MRMDLKKLEQYNNQLSQKKIEDKISNNQVTEIDHLNKDMLRQNFIYKGIE
jgi:hypothetical protein